MSSEKNKEVAKRIHNTIEDITDKKSQLFFFVIDSKNNPNGSLSYIYQMAKTLQNKGYNIKMLYNRNVFCKSVALK